MLIKRKVLETIPDPWWETHTAWPKGLPPISSTEDLDFCKKVREAGFRIFCNLDAPIGHITPMIVWPSRRTDGSWWTAISRGVSKVEIPAARSPLAVETKLVLR